MIAARCNSGIVRGATEVIPEGETKPCIAFSSEVNFRFARRKRVKQRQRVGSALSGIVKALGEGIVGLLLMILGLVLFLGAHTLTTQRDLRARLIRGWGEGTYKSGYALASLIGLALIAWGFSSYRATGWIDVWYPPTVLKHITVALMLPAVILVVAAYIRGRIYSAVKHPMLAGVKLWAAGHLLANGDLGSMILFGSFLAWAVYDRISLKRRVDLGAPPIPVGGVGNDLLAVAVGIVAYLALAFAFHPVVIGVPVVGA
jgi:uncharacterized membrane protein